ncbi:23S rRNA accumulation protein YceD [Pseudoalteromonas sp. Cnat2-41]|uniref:23S rRNA accumulation protein YceD n=1 Tax=unclassified Pseudoalteromonas TaxID=194690 RepID=UPI001EF8A192|nr:MULTISPECIES: 23S rRNA accumulation protein YceD [unclassified Pseudoalteromonas]MCF2861362.1 23S rRNA accumulation protein YceD [Pseudoalteromonas sp. CNAT2-18]MCG7557599.1 23S rRNA accumulation protein YceD [Pseudoalteromonas sp. CNAT2-18.1]
MQKVKIPVTLDPGRAATRKLEYDGVIRFEELSRFEQVVLDSSGEIAVHVHCKHDEQGLTVLSGSIKTTVTLTCQRCNEEFRLDLDQHFAYTPVGIGAESGDLPDYYDVVELDENGEVNLRKLVEDELILAIPIVPMHDEASCRYSEEAKSFGEIEAEDEKPNPFEILKQLKKDS